VWDRDVEDKARGFRQRLEEQPQDGELWFDYGVFLQCHGGDSYLALQALETARDLLPHNDLRLQLGQAYINVGQFEKGISLMRDTATASPRPEAYCFLANAHLNNEMMWEAERACRAALELDPEYEEAFFLLGEALRDERRAEAIECYRRAVELDPVYQLAWQALGRELIHAHETLNEGLECLQKAIRLDPEDGWARAYYANALWQARRVAEADEQYKASIRLLPEVAEAYRWYAHFLEAQGRTAEAERQERETRRCDRHGGEP